MKEIFHRISVRRYEDRPVDKALAEQVIRAAMAAPSAGNQQPWEFYVVTNKEKLIALSESHRYAGCAANAPAAIVPVYRKKGLWLPEYAHIDMAIAQENMWLMTDALGLGGVWLGIAPQQERMAALREILELPDDLEAFSIFVLGYPAGAKKAQENRFDENRIHYVV
jgi:nitroreductase